MSFGFAPRAANAYAQVGLETGVSTADPHKLVLMLFEGALLSIAKASAALDSQDIPGKGMAISKAIDRAGFLVIATAMRECIGQDGEDFKENQHDLERMFLSLA